MTAKSHKEDTFYKNIFLFRPSHGILKEEMSKTGRRSSPQTGKWESKELGASQGRKNRSAVDPAPEKGMEQADQAERRSCLAER